MIPTFRNWARLGVTKRLIHRPQPIRSVRNRNLRGRSTDSSDQLGQLAGRRDAQEGGCVSVGSTRCSSPRGVKANRLHGRIGTFPVGRRTILHASRHEASSETSRVWVDVRGTKWEKKADVDGDGKVSAKELRTHHRTVMDKDGNGKIDAKERRMFWLKKKSKVNTAYEKKYDADGDGYISGDEAKELLRDRLRVINTHGRAIVNTDLEREYDANGDGIIDKEEAKAIKDAIGDK